MILSWPLNLIVPGERNPAGPFKSVVKAPKIQPMNSFADHFHEDSFLP